MNDLSTRTGLSTDVIRTWFVQKRQSKIDANQGMLPIEFRPPRDISVIIEDFYMRTANKPGPDQFEALTRQLVSAPSLRALYTKAQITPWLRGVFEKLNGFKPSQDPARHNPTVKSVGSMSSIQPELVSPVIKPPPKPRKVVRRILPEAAHDMLFGPCLSRTVQ